MPAFRLLAHSHGVAFLDAVTDWRSRVRLAVDSSDPRFGAAFQGWFGGSVPEIPFEVSYARPGRPARDVEAWVISPRARFGALVGLEPGADGKPQPRVYPGYYEGLCAWRGGPPIVSIIRGNEFALTMFGRFPPYDFIDADVPAMIPGARVIDEAYVERFVFPWAEMVFHPLRLAREITGARVLHVLPPPPRERIENVRHLEEVGEVARQFGFVPETLRVKWYHRYCGQVRARLATIGVDCVGAPPEALTDGGLLREEFSEGLTHGNKRYGELIAAQVDAWLESKPP